MRWFSQGIPFERIANTWGYAERCQPPTLTTNWLSICCIYLYIYIFIDRYLQIAGEMNHFKHLKTRSLTLTDCNKRWIPGRCEFHTHLLARGHISFSGMKQWNCFLPTKTIHVWHIHEAHNFHSPSLCNLLLSTKNKIEANISFFYMDNMLAVQKSPMDLASSPWTFSNLHQKKNGAMSVPDPKAAVCTHPNPCCMQSQYLDPWKKKTGWWLNQPI